MTKKKKIYLSMFMAVVMIMGCCKVIVQPITALDDTEGITEGGETALLDQTAPEIRSNVGGNSDPLQIPEEVYNSTSTAITSDSTGIEDDTVYCIMNYASGRIISLEWVSTELCTNITAYTRQEAEYAQWRTELLSNGKYRFINEHIGEAQRMEIYNNNAETYTAREYAGQQFDICRVDDPDSNYDGLYLIMNQGGYLTQNSNGDFHNVCRTTTLTSYCYWSFMKVEKRYADFFYFDYPAGDANGDGIIDNFYTGSNSSLFTSVFNSIDYTPSTRENPTASYAYEKLTTRDDVFIFAGHGAPGMIGFYDYNGTLTGGILSHSAVAPLSMGSDRKIINSISDNGLAETRMVLYLGCETGVDFVRTYTRYNLVDYTYDKGAHFVLGTTEILFTLL